MKKNLQVVIVFVFMAFVSAGVFYLLNSQNQVEITQVLPEKPIFYFRLNELGKTWQEYQQTQLWKKLTAIKVVSLLEELGTPSQDLDAVKRVKELAESPVTQLVFDKFFSQEAALAVYPMDPNDSGTPDLKKMAEHIYLVLRPKPEAQFADVIGKFFTAFSKGVTYQEEDYQQFKIHLLLANDGTFSVGYVQIKDLLIVGVGDKPAKTAVNIWLKKDKALVDDTQFVLAKSDFLDKSDSAGYFNYGLFIPTLKNWTLQLLKQQQAFQTDWDKNAALVEKQLDQSLAQMKGMELIAFSGQGVTQAISKMDVHFDPAQMDPDLRKLYACRPSDDNQTLKFTPQNVLAYQWTGCYDFSYYWQQIKNELERARQQAPVSAEGGAESVISALEKTLGLSIEKDILPVLGDEVGGYLTDVEMSSIFPIPQLTFFLKVTSQEKAQELMDQLIKLQPFFRPEGQDVEGYKLYSINVPMVSRFQPGYVFISDFLLISSNKELLEQSIHTYKGQSANLTANAGLKNLNIDFSDHASSLFFLQSDELMKKGEQFVDWGNSWYSLQLTRQEAFKTGSEKRLADMKGQMKKDEAELEGFKTEYRSINDRVNAGAVIEPGVLEELHKKIDQKRQGIQAAGESAQELEKLIKGYEGQKGISADIRQKLIDEAIKPFLQAFSAMKVIASKTIFKDTLAETWFYSNVE